MKQRINGRTVVVLLLLLALLWMFLSTSIISAIANRNNPIRSYSVNMDKSITIPTINHDVNFASVNNDLTRTVQMRGWIEEYDGMGNEKLLLISPRHTYIMDIELLSDGGDGESEDEEEENESTSEDIEMIDFSVSFSSIALENGNYATAVASVENSQITRLVTSKNVLTKQYDKVSIFTYNLYENYNHIFSLVENQDEMAGDTTARFAAGSWVLEDGALTVSGWAYVNDRLPEDQTILLEVTEIDGTRKTYEAMNTIRPDLYIAFNDIEYIHAGFYGFVDHFENTPVSVRLISMYKDGAYPSADTYFLPGPDMNTIQLEDAPEGTQASIDMFDRNGEYTYINGWALLPDVSAQEAKAYVCISYADGSKTLYHTQTDYRQELADVLGGSDYGNAAFSTYFFASRDDVQSVEFVLEHNGTYYLVSQLGRYDEIVSPNLG
ncbi:MAG: hypothetical protein LBM60_05100 [Clostridium sp.]|jgi:hypothetical protein|nr:hypothetical protein [Clostridium sp.]